MISEQHWIKAFQMAEEDNTTVEPTRYLEELSKLKNPLIRELDSVGVAEIAFREYVTPLIDLKNRAYAPDENDLPILAERISWVKSVLKEMQISSPATHVFVALIRIASVMRDEQSLWSRLPTEYLNNNLLSRMAAFIGCTEMSFSPSEQAAPIWEHEVTSRFMDAGKAKDWPIVAQLWQTISGTLRPDYALREATHCLCQNTHGKHLIASMLDKSDNILLPMVIGEYLTVRSKAEISSIATTDQTRFILLMSLAYKQPRQQSLPVEVTDDIIKVLRLVQSNKDDWRKWMKALNRYPVRYPCVQEALGQSLIGSDKTIKSIYLDSIELSGSLDGGRLAVSRCLSSFHSSADEAECKLLFKLAYERWTSWNYAESIDANNLSWIAVSTLDYAVLGYLIECLEDSDFDRAFSESFDAMNVVGHRWYSDVSRYHTEWYRCLSRWAIYQFAKNVREQESDWTFPDSYSLPFDPEMDRYHALKYPTQGPHQF